MKSFFNYLRTFQTLFLIKNKYAKSLGSSNFVIFNNFKNKIKSVIVCWFYFRFSVPIFLKYELKSSLKIIFLMCDTIVLVSNQKENNFSVVISKHCHLSVSFQFLLFVYLHSQIQMYAVPFSVKRNHFFHFQLLPAGILLFFVSYLINFDDSKNSLQFE